MRLLFHTAALVHPLNSGGRIRTAKLIEQLARRHDVHVVVGRRPSDPPEAVASLRELGVGVRTVPCNEAPFGSLRCCGELLANAPRPMPYVIRRYHSAAMTAALREEVRRFAPHVVVCDALQNEPNVRDLGVPLVLSSHNVEATILQRLWPRTPGAIRRAYLWLEWQKLVRFEAAAVRRFAGCVAVSDDDARVFSELGAREVVVVPNGVDADSIRPTEADHDGSLAFVGSMDWAPNQDAIRWYVEQVAPLLGGAAPRLRVIGRSPPGDLVRWAVARAAVEFTGTVDDVRPHLARAVATVVPLRVGGGTRLKILEALAMAKPVVSTTIGAEGLGLTHDRELLIADDARSFAAAIERVIHEPDTRARLGVAGRTRVVRDHDWRTAGEILSQACEAAARA